jgi:hypothetical protein
MRWTRGGPVSPGTCPIPVLSSVQGKVVQEEENLPPGTVPVLLSLERKETTSMPNAPNMTGSLPLQIKGHIYRSQDTACMQSVQHTAAGGGGEKGYTRGPGGDNWILQKQLQF